MRMGMTALAVLLAGASAFAQERWDKDNGKDAPRLFAAGWVGTPVSLDALRRATPEATTAEGGTVAGGPDTGGNTVVLAFWNADIPC